MSIPSDPKTKLSVASPGTTCAPSVDSRIRVLRAQMGQLSREIGTARELGESTDDLINEMKMISAECKRLERGLKLPGSTSLRHEVAASDLHRDAAETTNVKPEWHCREVTPPDQLEYSELAGSTPGWDQYVTNHPRSSAYHLLCWKRIIESSFGHETHYLTARDQHGKLVGVLPLVRQKSALFGDFLTSMPFLNYGGPLGNNDQIELGLMMHAGQLASRLGCAHTEFRDTLSRPGWAVRNDKVSMRLDLPSSAEALWSSFPSKLRSQVRRAERESPTVVIGGGELLADFYRVFSRNMRDLGTPVYSRRFFEQIMTANEANASIAIVRLGTKPVSAGILIGFKGGLEIPWASTLKEAMPMAMNMFFYWTVLRRAIETGHAQFDFGRSTRGSGTYRFKRQWRTTEFPLYWHYWLNLNRQVPRINPDNPKYDLAISIWKKLPVWFTNIAGPSIASRLP